MKNYDKVAVIFQDNSTARLRLIYAKQNVYFRLFLLFVLKSA